LRCSLVPVIRTKEEGTLLNKWWIVALSLIVASLNTTLAQPLSDVEAIKAANQAFYAAFSAKDIRAMQEVWSNRPYVLYYNPRSKTTSVGYDEVMDTWAKLFENLTNINIVPSSVEVKTDGKIAWVACHETAEIQRSNSDKSEKIETIATNIFEKQRGRWLMISHQAQMVIGE
jgi:ketosteroid isomerase-like protein